MRHLYVSIFQSDAVEYFLRTLKQLIDEHHYTHQGIRNVFFQYIQDSRSAYWWARLIGDPELVKNKITDPKWIRAWNELFLLDPILEEYQE